MLMWRKTLVLLTIIGTLALFGAASALASGPSAGDQQYVDPLAGQHSSHHSSGSGSGPSSSSSGAGSGSSSAPATSTPPAATPSSSATVSGSSTATTASSTPTATTASATLVAGDPPGTLPRTGFDAWQAAALGLAMAGGGLCLRRAVRAR